MSYEIGASSVRKEDYNNKILREYLLDLLPEDETERLDELSVTDEEFAQKLIIAEHDLIDAYVNGELIEKELPQFREQYSRSPHRIERVRFAQAFQLINKTRDETEVIKADDIDERLRTSIVSFFNFSNWFTLKWGLVTSSLLVFVIASWFFVQQLRQRSPHTSSQAPEVMSDSGRQGRNDQEDHRLPDQSTPASGAKTEQGDLTERPTTQPANQSSPRVVAFVLKPQMRTVSQPVELTIPNNTTTVAVTLQLGLSDTNYFRTMLIEPSSDRTVWKGGRVKTTTTDDIRVLKIRVPAGLLKQQMYRIRVVGIYPNGTEETTDEYSFRVIK